MQRLQLTKPDGRDLWLYSRRPIVLPAGTVAPSPRTEPVVANPHMRWHPLRQEWVTYATHRQNRTFLPPPEYNPLAVCRDPHNPTELPVGDYDVAVFENLFPSFSLTADAQPPLAVPTRPAQGRCELVVFTQDPTAALGRLPLDHIELVLEVWADRTTALGRHSAVHYVMPFENRGVEVGVTLHHPHGQLYAFPIVPPLASGPLASQKAYMDQHGRGLLADMLAAEIAGGERLLYAGPHAAAFVPICARYAYEVWVLPRRRAAFLADLLPEERADLARALKTVLLKYDGLWQRPFPYLMAVHQAPTDGTEHPEAHLRFEFYPPYRTPEKLKYLAGTELGAGVFAADSLPEDKAKELQAVSVTLD